MLRLKARDGTLFLFWDCEDYRIWTWKAHPPDDAIVEVVTKADYAKLRASPEIRRLMIDD